MRAGHTRGLSRMNQKILAPSRKGQNRPVNCGKRPQMTLMITEEDQAIGRKCTTEAQSVQRRP